MTKFEFQPFDKVLVRNSSRGIWKADVFSHKEARAWSYICLSTSWKFCIPYNETTKHLCGTSDPYIDSAEAPAFEFGDVVAWDDGGGEVVTGTICVDLDSDGDYGIVVKGDILITYLKEKDIMLIRKGNFND